MMLRYDEDLWDNLEDKFLAAKHFSLDYPQKAQLSLIAML